MIAVTRLKKASISSRSYLLFILLSVRLQPACIGTLRCGIKGCLKSAIRGKSSSGMVESIKRLRTFPRYLNPRPQVNRSHALPVKQVIERL